MTSIRSICSCAAFAIGVADQTRRAWAETEAGQEVGQGAWTHEVTYTADVAGTVRGGTAHAGRALDNLDVIIDGDLEKLVGWRGATVHGYLLNNSGGALNDLAGTLQGVDNIEVGRPRARLYELWVQSGFADDHGSVLAGLYDLNSGSSIPPRPRACCWRRRSASARSSPRPAPTVRRSSRPRPWRFARRSRAGGGLCQAAVLNAHAGTVGDPDGPSTEFDHRAPDDRRGLGIGDSWRVAAGGWFYTERQPDLRDLDAHGDPALSKARGGYLLAEYPFVDGGEAGARRCAASPAWGSRTATPRPSARAGRPGCWSSGSSPRVPSNT